MRQADLSKVISEMWQNEPPEVREEWDRRAQEAKALHTAMHPDYRYQPQRKGKRSKKSSHSRSGSAQASASTSNTPVGNGMSTEQIPGPPSFELEPPNFGGLGPNVPIQVSRGSMEYPQAPVAQYSQALQPQYPYVTMVAPSSQAHYGISTTYPPQQPLLADSTNTPRPGSSLEAGPSTFQESNGWPSNGGVEMYPGQDLFWIQWWESLSDAEREEYFRQAVGQGVMPGHV